MEIDVIDLNFDELNFSRRYDNSRRDRGNRIYRSRAVTIREVYKIDDHNYKILALVRGNYGLYRVNLSICGTIINESSCTCEDYQNGNLCKHIIATSMEVIEPHEAITKEGKEKLAKQREEEHKRALEAIRKRQEEEMKRREYEFKYEDGLKTINLYREMNNSPLGGEYTLDLPSLYERTKLRKNEKVGELATSVNLEHHIEISGQDTLKVSFKIGQDRMYVLNNISELYEAYKNNSKIYYGKQLELIPKRENFCKEAKPLFDYIIEYAEMVEYANRFSRYENLYPSNRELILTGDKIEKFFDIIKGKQIVLEFSECKQQFEFTDDELDIKYIINKEKVKMINPYNFRREVTETEEYVLKLNISNYYVLYSNTNIYVFYNNKIYKMQKNKENMRLFNTFANTEEILIPKDKLADFKNFVLPKIKNITTENLSDEFAKDVLVVNKLASKILLDADDEGNILLELKFCYGDYEFNVLENGYKKYVAENNIIRDIPAEKEVIERIFMDGFELITSQRQFVMQNTDDMYQFLSYKIEEYMKEFEVLATDKFKNKQIKQPKISNMGIRINNGLLELDISKINIDINEIKDVLRDYKVKNKYHKLKNGDFLDLTNNESLELLDEMSVSLDVDYSKIEDGVVNLPISRSIYLENLMNTNKNIKVSKNNTYTELIDNIENNDISDKIEIDESFEKILRDYQKVGYRWLKTLATYKFGGILADDMGLGKTLQVIALLKSEIKNKIPSMVVCPSSLTLNWKAEVEKWCSQIKVLIVKGTAEERKELINNCENYNLIITSYDLLKRDISEYEEKRFKYIIADEAQYVKNSSTQNAKALKSLNGEVRFALTGTPIENSVAELWSIFDFIMPGYLYTYSKFQKKFEKPILKDEDTEALTRLKKLISPFILRRVKKDVLTELPEKNITIMKNEMGEEQQKIYLSYLAQTKKELSEELNQGNFEKSKLKILMLLTRLRQICCHPSLFIENYYGGSGKLDQCMDLITDAIESGHKILLFSSYTSIFDIIEKQLKSLNINYFKLVGNTPVDKRIEMVDKFNSDSSVKIFLISLKAGGTGLNLTSADVVIHYDPWWNISSENQATDRAYRIGQKNSVQVYKLITSNSIEEKISKMQERKEKLSKDLLSTEETFINKMSKEEILNLFE